MNIKIMFKTDLQLREQSWIFTKFPFNVPLWGGTTIVRGEGIKIWSVKRYYCALNPLSVNGFVSV